MLLEKPTGDTYIPNCTTNGTMNRKSRYFTFNDANHNPTPIAAQNARSVNSGNATIRQLGMN